MIEAIFFPAGTKNMRAFAFLLTWLAASAFPQGVVETCSG